MCQYRPVIAARALCTSRAAVSKIAAAESTHAGTAGARPCNQPTTGPAVRAYPTAATTATALAPAAAERTRRVLAVLLGAGDLPAGSQALPSTRLRVYSRVESAAGLCAYGLFEPSAGSMQPDEEGRTGAVQCRGG